MTAKRFAIFPQDEPEQVLRLKRFFFAGAAYVMNVSFVLACWWMDYFTTLTVAIYGVMVIVINAGFYLTIRTGLNKRFADPSLTTAQMAIATLSGLYLMYYADEFRSAFLLLGVAALAFGMFRFKARGFIYFALFILFSYGILIELLWMYRPQEAHLKVEVVQWMALFVTLVQFSFLASYIGNLRRAMSINNQELEKRNKELEVALQRISDMAVHDELTGIYNRRYLMERTNEESERCARTGTPFSTCIIDVDHFKRINDTYGHFAGDRVLQGVVNAMAATLRQTDVLGRFGGEEFVAILIDTPASGAMITAERLRHTVEQMAFDEIDPALKVTVSIGVAEHKAGTIPSLTFKNADHALYRAKDGGRNRSVLAEDISAPEASGAPLSAGK